MEFAVEAQKLLEISLEGSVGYEKATIMTKQEHIKWWLDESDRNWDTAIFNRDGGQNVFS